MLLHEWAHTLGAFHERDPESIMSPMYAPAATAFSVSSARIVALGLARRASGTPGADAAWAREYREAVEHARGDAWDAATVEGALAAAATLASAAAEAPRSAAANAAGGGTARAERGDTAILARADMNDRLGDPAQAWKLVEPIAARLATHGRLQEYACHLRRRAGQTFAPGDACGSRKPLTPRAAALLFGNVLLEEGDRQRAVEVLLRAETTFAEARSGASAADWGDLAEALSRMDACTAAERAAVHAPSDADARRAASRCERTRRRVALPAGRAAVEPAREPEYVDAVLRARAEAEGGRVVPARASAAALEAAFPGAPGGPLVRCLVDAQGGDPAAARATCSAADRAAPAAPEPPHILGLMAGDEGRWTEARDLLARAVERDEGDRRAWAHLATAHQKLGDGAALDAPARRFRQRFGGTLVPEW